MKASSSARRPLPQLRALPEAIESALAQDYPRLEVLVIDDGSTTTPLDVASRYDVNMLTENRASPGPATAAPARRGEYFLFLSADDLLEPTYVSELLAALRARARRLLRLLRPSVRGRVPRRAVSPVQRLPASARPQLRQRQRPRGAPITSTPAAIRRIWAKARSTTGTSG